MIVEALLNLVLFSHSKARDFDALWDYSNPRGTLDKFQGLELLGQAQLQLQTQVARCQGLLREFTQAHQTLDLVEQALPKERSLTHVRYHLERGRVFYSSKKKTQARTHFVKALELAKRLDLDFYAVDAAHMLGIAGESAAKRMQWNKQALGLAESSQDKKARGWLASLYNNMGWAHHDAGNYTEALKLFRKGLEERISKGKTGPILVARWSVARTLRSLNRDQEALAMQQSLEREHESQGSSDGYVFEELGELHLKLKKEKAAAKYFGRAFEELSKDPWMKANEAERLSRIKELSKG